VSYLGDDEKKSFLAGIHDWELSVKPTWTEQKSTSCGSSQHPESRRLLVGYL
jgi:hypothetical protein